MSLTKNDMQQVTLQQIYELAQKAKGKIKLIIDHWSAGRYGQFFEEYDIQVDGDDGLIYMPDMDLEDYDQHCWHRNTGSVGAAIACCYGATSNDLGDYPPSEEAIESLCKVNAVLMLGLGLDEEDCLTHGQQAEIDGYGIHDDDPEMRWDLAKLRDNQELEDGYEEIRSRTLTYLEYYQENGIPSV